MKRHLKLSDILIGILFTLFFISIGAIIAINFRYLYYFDINYLNITESSGFDRKTILENYNALIDYCSPFFTENLVFPSFPSSQNALIHFAEVKKIFNFFYFMGFVCFLLLIMIVQHKYQKKDTFYLKVSSITSIVLPTLIGSACAINFDRLFILFHTIFFKNDYWLFDPETDPIINILPDTFFLHCAIVIIVITLFGSASLFYISKKLEPKISSK